MAGARAFGGSRLTSGERRQHARRRGGQWALSLLGGTLLGRRAVALASQPALVVQQEISPSRFSSLAPGAGWTDRGASLAGWHHQQSASITPNQFSVAPDPAGQLGSSNGPVLWAQVDGSASALIYRFEPGPLVAERLAWRWRSDRFPPGQPGVRAADDFAARIYLMFDYPLERLPLGDRWLLRAGRALHDPALPAATLVYLLYDRKASPDPIDSPYTRRVRMIVAREQAQPDRWYEESRDIAKDFRAAFGSEYGQGPTPALTALAVGADGDQTRASFNTWFGDLHLSLE